MKPELEKLARHRLGRAKDAFREGEQLVSQKSYMGAVNRFYYAAFYAARALLALQELDSSRHSGVIALFQKYFVKPGKFPTEIAKALPRAFEKRQKSDYGDFSTITTSEAQSIRDEVKLFVDECASVMEKLITTAE